MDLIGSISYIENRLGGRKPNQGGGKPAQKSVRIDTAGKEEDPADAHPFPAENDARLGRKVDTTA